MINDELLFRIREQLGFTPTDDQTNALHTFAAFLTDRNPQSAMILRGSAGTGKTSLASAIVRTMTMLRQKVLLLAPTGRAAKVFSVNSGSAAYTIHHRIYRQRAYTGTDGQFNLNDNLFAHTLFIIDEASMIANEGFGDSSFGSGRLLDDLVQFVYGGHNCRMLLIGDKSQLPPIGESESPALSDEVLSCYGLYIYTADLNQVMRQGEASGILRNANNIKKQTVTTRHDLSPNPSPSGEKSYQASDISLFKVQIRLDGKLFSDISVVPGDELIEQLHSSYAEVGIDETIVITRSNKRANVYNLGIRNTVLGREEEITTGDILMVVKNNYYWTEKEKSPIAFIANGDRAIVQRVRNVRDAYGFRFADVLLQFPDYNRYEMQTTVLLDTLRSEAPALTREQTERLFNEVMADYDDVPTKQERLKKLRQDDLFNAIQVKYAYAVTCHKAQGGQWAHVYLDQGYITSKMMTPDYAHWLYTAFTRATEHLYLVNWPKTQLEGADT